jgi:hypothetical protein
MVPTGYVAVPIRVTDIGFLDRCPQILEVVRVMPATCPVKPGILQLKWLSIDHRAIQWLVVLHESLVWLT